MAVAKRPQRPRWSAEQWLRTPAGEAWLKENSLDRPIDDPVILARIAAIIGAAPTDEDYIAAMRGEV